MDKKNEHKLPGESPENKQFQANSRYFTISIYAIGVIIVAILSIKLFISWNETVSTIKAIISILMPFIIGALIAFILNPAVKHLSLWFEKYLHMRREKPRRLLATAVAYLLVLGLISVIFFGIVPQLSNSITDLVNYIPTMVNQLYHFVDNLEQHFPDLDMNVVRNAINDALPDFITYVKDLAANIVPALYQFSMVILQWLLNLAIAIIVSIYMLSDKKPLKNSFKASIYALVPVKHIDVTMEILREAYHLFSSFIIGKAIDSAIIGALCFLLMTLLQFPYALLISVIVGVTNMIPYFGPFIGAVPGVILMLMISPVKAFILVILILVLQQFDGLILGPKILGDSTGLKPLWIIIAITIGGSLGGVLGMFLGVPVVAFLRYLLNRFLLYRLHKKNLLDSDDFTLE